MKQSMARAISAAGAVGAASLMLALPAQADAPTPTPPPSISSSSAAPNPMKISLSEGESATMDMNVVIPSIHSTKANPEAPAIIVPGDSGHGSLIVTNNGPTNGTLKVYLLNPDHTSVKKDDPWMKDLTFTANKVTHSVAEWEAQAKPLTAAPGDTEPARGALVAEMPLAKGASTTVDLAYDFPFEATSANAGGQHSYEKGKRTARTDLRVVIEGEDVATPPAKPTPPSVSDTEPAPAPPTASPKTPTANKPAPAPKKAPHGAVTGDAVRNLSPATVAIGGVLGVISLATITILGRAFFRKTLLKEN